MSNTRPLLTSEDRELLKFVLASMRDDRDHTAKHGVFGNDKRYDQAEELFKRLIPDHYRSR